jgi:class 3 adenylate cyclase/tetratricopeptide (TPR) repeat protein
MRKCPICGEENPDRARFCMACTAPLASASPRDVRKTVTIVFSDLKGSTDLGEALDPESLRTVVSMYFDRMSAVLEMHGATVEKFIGDAVMAVFGLPRAHEDDALRAVRAAAEMRVALDELNRDLERRWGIRLTNRTGVNTGEVVAGDSGMGQRLVTGDVVNTAARLEQNAGGGETLLGARTYQLVRDHVDVHPAGLLDLKGKAEPVPAYRLVGITDSDGAFANSGNVPMVGRRRELMSLHAALDEAVRERRCVGAWVVGEPGVGKSRLLLELERTSRDRVRIARGRCPAYGRGITFFALQEIVACAVEAETGHVGHSPESVTAWLERWLGGRLSADGPAARVGLALGITSDPFPLEEVFWGIRTLLTRLADDRPLLVVVEDIHWAEPTFLDLLDFLEQTITGSPMLLVCSARPDIFETRSDRSDSRLTVTVDALAAEDVGQLIEQRIRSTPLQAPLQQRIREASGGNPLFIEQFLAMIDGATTEHAHTSSADQDALPVPPSISALLTARLDGLPADERAVIELASIPGQVFRRAAVRALCERPLRAEVDQSLASLSRKMLVQLQPGGTGDGPGTFIFNHVLIRDCAYGGMLKRRRAGLHERFADWLRAGRNELPSDAEELLGYHLETAVGYWRELGDLDARTAPLAREAGRLLASAGRRALARGDVGAAARWLRRAVDMWPPGDVERLPATIELGAALREGGEYAEAAVLLEQAIAEAKTTDEVGLECRAVVERVEVGMKVDAPGWADRAMPESQRLIPLLEAAGDDLGLAKIWRMISWVHGEHGSLAGWDEASHRSIAHARRAGNRLEEVEVLAGLAINQVYGPAHAEAGLERCKALAESVKGNRRAEAFVLTHIAELQAMLSLFDAARETARQAIETFEDIGAFAHALEARSVAAAVELADGATTKAEELLLEIYTSRETRAASESLPWRHDLELANVRCEQGRHADALELAERATKNRLPHPPAYALAVKARALAGTGEITAGMACAREAVALAANDDDVVLRGTVWMSLGEILRLNGSHAEATQALTNALEIWKAKGHVVMEHRARRELTAQATGSCAGNGEQ